MQNSRTRKLIYGYRSLNSALLGMHAQSLQSCLTFCNPTDCSPSGSSIHEESPGKNTELGCHALLQGIFLTQIKPTSLMSPALAGGFFTTSAT